VYVAVVLRILISVGVDVGNGYVLIPHWKELYDNSMWMFLTLSRLTFASVDVKQLLAESALKERSGLVKAKSVAMPTRGGGMFKVTVVPRSALPSAQ